MAPCMNDGQNWKFNFVMNQDEHGIFPCDKCSFVAYLPADIKKHIKYKHNNTFPCDQCEYAATRADSLRLHKEAVHEKIRWPCDMCDQSRSLKSDLHKHKKKMHPEAFT